MSWVCGNCGNANSSTYSSCSKCLLDRAIAVTINAVTVRKKRMCPDCGHRHREKIYCHVFCEASQDPDDYEGNDGSQLPIKYNDDDGFDEEGDGQQQQRQEEEEEDDDNNKEEDQDEVSAIRGIISQATKRDILHRRPLSNPSHLAAIGYIRCNCKRGVPSNNRHYEPIPAIARLGDIRIIMYDEILEKLQQKQQKYNGTIQEELAAIAKQKELEKRKLNSDFSPFLPMVLSYLKIGEISNIPIVCRDWNYGVSYYRDYIDLRDCSPWMAYRLYNGPVDSLVLYDNILFSGGDHRVVASDYTTGKSLATIARSSGDIPSMNHFQDDLFFGDLNGAIKTSGITHDPSNMIPGRTFWEHSRRVTKIFWALPTKGLCDMHGIIDHVCVMFTCSEDRTFRVWSTSTYECIKVVDTKTLRFASFLTMTQSGRHLFLGSTAAKIAIFSKHDICEREDVHNCNTPGVNKAYCLQITLKLPINNHMSSGNLPGVTQLLCAGPNYDFSMLWAGDTTGQISVWKTPRLGLSFNALKTWRAHMGAVRGLANTWRNMISIGDDGILLIYELESLKLMRKLDIVEWCNHKNLLIRPDIPRKLKCLCVQEDFEKGGTMVVGTSYGDIVVMSIGTQV